MTIVYTITFSVIVVFLAFILQKKNKTISDRFLALTIGLIGVYLLSEIWVKYSINHVSFILNNLIDNFIFPVFLTYAMLVIDRDGKVKRAWWWFWSYAVAITVFVLVDVFIIGKYDQQGLEHAFHHQKKSYDLFHLFHLVFVMALLLWFLRKLRIYRKEIKEYFSFIEPIRLQWLSNFCWTYLSIIIAFFLVTLSYNLGLIANEGPYQDGLNGLLLLALFYLAFHGIKQYAISGYLQINETKEISSSKDSSTTSYQKYQTSSLDQAEMETIHRRIVALFEKDEVYLNPELRLGDIAQSIGLSVHKVSQTLNSQAQMSFYDFVNNYRIKHCMKLISNPDNRKFTILALGLDSGFNSKATLNRIFKKQTGYSPMEYRKLHSAEVNV